MGRETGFGKCSSPGGGETAAQIVFEIQQEGCLRRLFLIDGRNDYRVPAVRHQVETVHGDLAPCARPFRRKRLAGNGVPGNPDSGIVDLPVE
jgi:hypothetical protein